MAAASEFDLKLQLPRQQTTRDEEVGSLELLCMKIDVDLARRWMARCFSVPRTSFQY